jgi:hypothetical protein
LFWIRQRSPRAQAHATTAHVQTIIQATIDIACLTLLLHACGGISSGLGLLLLVPVGGTGVSLPPRSALFLAAVAAIAVLVHTIWQQLGGHSDITVYAAAGFLGLVLFTIAASASVLATRVRESEDLVRQKDVDLANLADLSQYIVQHLRESLLVVDTERQDPLDQRIRGRNTRGYPRRAGRADRRGLSSPALLAEHVAAARIRK